LNINASSTNPVPSDARGRLVEALLDELLSWNPREFIVAFRRWHHDAFSLIHLNVLTILEMDGSSSMSRLAEALDVSVASMTGIVDRMEKRGLVERRRDGADRRVVLVYPTDTGRDVFREIDRRRREGLRKMLAQLGDEELAGLLAGHRALHTARAAVAAGSPGPRTPPGIHRPSTTSRDDRAVIPDRRRRA
jgi:DNA-binding MarR family transcriptional regulator